MPILGFKTPAEKKRDTVYATMLEFDKPMAIPELAAVLKEKHPELYPNGRDAITVTWVEYIKPQHESQNQRIKVRIEDGERKYYAVRPAGESGDRT